MSDELFVPDDFAVPDGLIAEEFQLAPLGPQHNEADYAAWASSIDHIRATPGFPDGSWPRVYLPPASGHEPGGGAEGRRQASVQSWVRADCAELDQALHDVVLAWLERDWPFNSIEYAPRR